MAKYIVSPAPLIFYSDSNIPAERKIGFDPTDMNNVAYQPPYNKPYSMFRGLGGFNVRPSMPTQAGDILDINIDNTTTNSSANSKNYSYTFSQSANPTTVIMVGMPDQRALAPGTLDIYGTITRPSTNTIYVFNSTFLDQVLP